MAPRSGANGKLTVQSSSDPQGAPVRADDELRRAQLLEGARKKIGSTPLEIAAQDYPIEEWRVWTSTYPRDYTEDSEEFPKKLQIFKENAEHVRSENAGRNGDPRRLLGLNNTADWMPWYELRSGVPCGPYKGEIPDHHSLPKGRAELLEEARKKIGSTPVEIAAQDFPIEAWRVWATTFPRDYTENSQEFPERLRIFMKNAEVVRTENERPDCKTDPSRMLLCLNGAADQRPWNEMLGGVLLGPYTGGIAEPEATHW